MKKVFSKLKSRLGETFTEILVALLIVALASMLLVSMYSASGSIDMATREQDKEFYEAISQVEKMEGTGDPGTITVSGGGTNIEINVNVYSDTDGTLKAYK